MSAVSAAPVSSVPEFAGILRNRLEAIANKAIAAETGIDASQVGKFLNGQAALKLDDVQRLLTLAQLKAVDVSRVCVKREEIALLRRVYAVVADQAPWLMEEREA